MSDSSQRTEKPTPRRLEQARREGQFAVSKDFVAGIQFVVFASLLGVYGRDWLTGLAELWRQEIGRAFHVELTVSECRRWLIVASKAVFLPMLAAGAVLTLSGLAAHFAVTRLGFSTKKLMPDLSRLSPLKRLAELPKQNLVQLAQAAVMMPLFFWAVWVVAKGHVAAYMQLPFLGIHSGLRVVADSIDSLLWKAAALLLAWGAIDWLRQHQRFAAGLRMSKQEVRDDAKQSEGNPQVKGRIRRLQRDFARRRMMKEIPTATAVVVNPTHFAVALRYEMDSMVAPLVVAKGKNFLALRIRDKAIAHHVPLVENPPLAQALYQSVNVGQEIPAALYRAVAEILAYIYQVRGTRA